MQMSPRPGSLLLTCQARMSTLGGVRLVTEVYALCWGCLEEVAWGAARGRGAQAALKGGAGKRKD